MSILNIGNAFVPMRSGHHEVGVGCCACGTDLSAGMVWWISVQSQLGVSCIGIFESCTCAKVIYDAARLEDVRIDWESWDWLSNEVIISLR